MSTNNQIGGFFESMPDRQEALEGIVMHLKKFWDPRMRRDFLGMVDGDTHGKTNYIVLEAMRLHRAILI